ncbi:MAG: hypothetical protein HKM03_04280 [Steroidobacteraceae bacterium]|nr:hypothetical protein [Steroidobacteraceae bacterium]
MSARARLLVARRERLCARSGVLRGELRRDLGALAGRMEFADRVASLAASPWTRLLATVGATLLLFRRPRRLVRLMLRLAPFVPVVRPYWRRWLRGFRARAHARAPGALNPQP